MILEAILTCPKCAHRKEETMPERYLEVSYVCEKCHAILKPKDGDDCVFCSYSNTICPEQQEKRDCCSG